MSAHSRIKEHGPIGSLAEFVAVSGEIIRASGLKQSAAGVWWRGQSNASWQLLPSLYRGSIPYELERETVRDFKLKSLPFIRGIKPTLEVEWLFLMQHHGAPTRILDSTESPLVALYFSVADFENQEDAVVWALHPWILNIVTIGSQTIAASNSVHVKDWIIDTDDTEIARAPVAKLPIAVRVEYGFNRAHSQRGMATIHGERKTPINALKAEVNEARIFEYVKTTPLTEDNNRKIT